MTSLYRGPSVFKINGRNHSQTAAHKVSAVYGRFQAMVDNYYTVDLIIAINWKVQFIVYKQCCLHRSTYVDNISFRKVATVCKQSRKGRDFANGRNFDHLGFDVTP